MKKHYLNGLFATVLVLLSQFFVSSSYAVPVFYSLHGTASVSDGPIFSPGLYSSFTGTMVIDSVPTGQFPNPNDPYSNFNVGWSVESITINSAYLLFYGAGYLRLTGSGWGIGSICDYNEAAIYGYAITPYYAGNISFNGSAGGTDSTFFYHADGTRYADSIAAYSAGLPDIISTNYSNDVRIYGGGGWSSTNAINISFDGIKEQTAPVPEPSTILLLGFGILGIALIRRMKNV